MFQLHHIVKNNLRARERPKSDDRLILEQSITWSEVSIGNKNKGEEAEDFEADDVHGNEKKNKTNCVKFFKCVLFDPPGTLTGRYGWRRPESGVKPPRQRTVVEPCGLALGEPLMALKMPKESDRALRVPSSTGFIYKEQMNRKTCKDNSCFKQNFSFFFFNACTFT